MAAPVSVAAAPPVSLSTTYIKPASRSTPHSASLFGGLGRGRECVNPAKRRPPKQPRSCPSCLSREIKEAAPQPLYFFAHDSLTIGSNPWSSRGRLDRP